jgi:hypothetical protein
MSRRFEGDYAMVENDIGMARRVIPPPGWAPAAALAGATRAQLLRIVDREAAPVRHRRHLRQPCREADFVDYVRARVEHVALHDRRLLTRSVDGLLDVPYGVAFRAALDRQRQPWNAVTMRVTVSWPSAGELNAY